MTNYTMACESGAVVLVSAESADAAERAWDRDAAKGDAENRVPGTTARATRIDVSACVDAGHDYRRQ